MSFFERALEVMTQDDFGFSDHFEVDGVPVWDVPDRCVQQLLECWLRVDHDVRAMHAVIIQSARWMGQMQQVHKVGLWKTMDASNFANFTQYGAEYFRKTYKKYHEIEIVVSSSWFGFNSWCTARFNKCFEEYKILMLYYGFCVRYDQELSTFFFVRTCWTSKCTWHRKLHLFFQACRWPLYRQQEHLMPIEERINNAYFEQVFYRKSYFKPSYSSTSYRLPKDLHAKFLKFASQHSDFVYGESMKIISKTPALTFMILAWSELELIGALNLVYRPIDLDGGYIMQARFYNQGAIQYMWDLYHPNPPMQQTSDRGWAQLYDSSSVCMIHDSEYPPLQGNSMIMFHTHARFDHMIWDLNSHMVKDFVRVFKIFVEPDVEAFKEQYGYHEFQHSRVVSLFLEKMQDHDDQAVELRTVNILCLLVFKYQCQDVRYWGTSYIRNNTVPDKCITLPMYYINLIGYVYKTSTEKTPLVVESKGKFHTVNSYDALNFYSSDEIGVYEDQYFYHPTLIQDIDVYGKEYYSRRNNLSKEHDCYMQIVRMRFQQHYKPYTNMEMYRTDDLAYNIRLKTSSLDIISFLCSHLNERQLQAKYVTLEPYYGAANKRVKLHVKFGLKFNPFYIQYSIGVQANRPFRYIRNEYRIDAQDSSNLQQSKITDFFKPGFLLKKPKD